MGRGVFLTLDVEAWFHHPGHLYGRDRGLWESLPSNLPGQMSAAFDLLDAVGSRATCFFLGWAARRHPELVREAISRGHEVACHGMNHQPVREMEPRTFREDLRESQSFLEDLAGAPILGFRAPAWSIHGAGWAYEVLAECGFLYSSSRLPIPGLGGRAGLHKTIAGVAEIPALASPWASAPFPAGGTVALRLLPMGLIEACREEALAAGRPAVYWFHPWELDLSAPILPGLSAPGRFLRYAGLRRLPQRLLRLAGGARRTLGEAVASACGNRDGCARSMSVGYPLRGDDGGICR
jgi:polysaccharide deacetylase family protein (PEP-CTERM system associated)